MVANKAWFAELENIHAPEIVEEAGRYFIARVSGPRHANRQAPEQGSGWVEVAELAFQPPANPAVRKRNACLYFAVPHR